mmetsp:Transcript_3110/g.9505  ORF Transcript_3110/g.9505 Transcript_3110/m.9505 type:complete len:223 (-) Transcript_3110:643-1311(-)
MVLSCSSMRSSISPESMETSSTMSRSSSRSRMAWVLLAIFLKSCRLKGIPRPSSECRVQPPTFSAATPVMAVTPTASRPRSALISLMITRRTVDFPVPPQPVRNRFFPLRTTSIARLCSSQRLTLSACAAASRSAGESGAARLLPKAPPVTGTSSKRALVAPFASLRSFSESRTGLPVGANSDDGDNRPMSCGGRFCASAEAETLGSKPLRMGEPLRGTFEG